MALQCGRMELDRRDVVVVLDRSNVVVVLELAALLGRRQVEDGCATGQDHVAAILSLLAVAMVAAGVAGLVGRCAGTRSDRKMASITIL
jgi:hypothetical protein